MKHTISTLIDAGHVWTAERVDAQAPVVTEPLVKDVELSCLNPEDNGKTYTAKNGGQYKVECGLDYAGGDLQRVDAETTFQSCMDACDATTGCIDVSWVWGSCYMKSELTATPAQLSHVWTGRRVESEPIQETSKPKTDAESCPGQSFSIGVTKGTPGASGNSYVGKVKLEDLQYSYLVGPMIQSIVPATDNTATKFKFDKDGDLVTVGSDTKISFLFLGDSAQMMFGMA